jgi:hypothetical protein
VLYSQVGGAKMTRKELIIEIQKADSLQRLDEIAPICIETYMDDYFVCELFHLKIRRLLKADNRKRENQPV